MTRNPKKIRRLLRKGGSLGQIAQFALLSRRQVRKLVSTAAAINLSRKLVA